MSLSMTSGGKEFISSMVKSIHVPMPGFVLIKYNDDRFQALRVADIVGISEAGIVTCRKTTMLLGHNMGTQTTYEVPLVISIQGADIDELFDKISCAADLEAAQKNLRADANLPAPPPNPDSH